MFTTVIEENPAVCSRCFFRHGSRAERENSDTSQKRARHSPFVNYEIPPPEPDQQFTWRLDWRYYESDRLPERVGRDYIPDEVGGGEYPAREGGKKTYCRNCGIVGSNQFDTAKTPLDALRAADTLSHTLREYAIPHDWRHLLEAVGGLKTIDPMADQDRTIFRTATEEAVTLALAGYSPETSFTPHKSCETCIFRTDGPTTEKLCPICNHEDTPEDEANRLYYTQHMDNTDLSRFQYQILYVLSDIGDEQIGIDIKDALADEMPDYLNHGRFYQNLRAMADEGYVQGSAINGRSNEYSLTKKGTRAIADDLAWRFERAEPGLEPGTLTVECETCGHEWDGHPESEAGEPVRCPSCYESDPQFLCELT
ncbi:hypothetical protein C449_01082 [Halococcus saccharolyticus DSM 5350]|uniref:Uncharacterized protein n=1 Tax=Halococcus saccharolyticus DSM 5350 TaxID=1227455 RepID=M0MQJ8_9EURY|nr:hypothetical protein C449_01082 [Halococcus saccharolyticus DSM 5350]